MEQQTDKKNSVASICHGKERAKGKALSELVDVREELGQL